MRVRLGTRAATTRLVEAARQVPQGVICLLSALRFHELTTQVPHEVWIALPPSAATCAGGPFASQWLKRLWSGTNRP
jgi:predicted transcriptional regulator of viral defense system